MCGELKDERWVDYLRSTATRGEEREITPEVRIAAAWALAKIGAQGVPVDVVLEYSRSPKPGLRAQAVAALGVIGDPRTALRIQQLMSDSHPVVQVAAAGAMLKLPQGG
jgi:HEAT repeat protein